MPYSKDSHITYNVTPPTQPSSNPLYNYEPILISKLSVYDLYAQSPFSILSAEAVGTYGMEL